MLKTNNYKSHSEKLNSTSSIDNCSYKSDNKLDNKHKNLNKKREIDYDKKREELRERSNSALRMLKLKNINNGMNSFKKIIEKTASFKNNNDPLSVKLNNEEVEILKAGVLIQIANIPFYLGLTKYEIEDFIIDKAEEHRIFGSNEIKHYGGYKNIVNHIELDEDSNCAILHAFNKKAAERFILLNGVLLLGHTLNVSYFIPTKLVENTYKGAAANANSADLSAKSAAVALAAIENYLSFNKDKKNCMESLDNDNTLKALTNIENSNTHLDKQLNEGINNNSTSEIKKSNVNNSLATYENSKVAKLDNKLNNYTIIAASNTLMRPSRVLKIINIIDNKIRYLSDSEYKELKESVYEEFVKFGKIINFKFIASRKQIKIGAKLGDLFIVYNNLEDSVKALNKMKNAKYEDKKLKLVYVNEEAYLKDILNKQLYDIKQ